MSLRSAFLALLINVTIAGPAAADPTSWANGMEAFSADNYEAALAHFTRARDEGLDGPAVHYNIAVSQFKLAQYDAAAETFALLAEHYPQMEGLAEYNLGLIARRQDRRQVAARHFLNAYNLSDDEKIRILASQRLRELEPETRTVSRWSGAVSVRAGNDDNIALRDEAGVPAGTTMESPVIDVFASLQGPRTAHDGFRFRGNAYAITYADANEYDQLELFASGYYEWRRDSWRAELGVHASGSTLGGDPFDRKAGAGARFVRYVGEASVVDLRYTYDDVSEGDKDFSGIAGSRQRIDGRYRWYRDDHRIQLRYIIETNDRESASVTRDRKSLIADYRLLPARGFGYKVGVEFRESEYPELEVPRDEDLVTLFGALNYTFASDWSVTLEFRQYENDSTDPVYSYDRRVVTLGALILF